MVSERVKQHLAEFEDRACTCGAGHGSLEGHTDWCDWSEYLSAAARVRAEDNAEAPQPSGTVGVKPLANLIHDALAFAVWAAGEGLCPTDGPPAPEDFLYAYSTATGFEDWDAIPHHVATTLSALTAGKPEQAVPSGWQPIETAPKDMTEVLLFDPANDPPVFTGSWIDGWSATAAGRYEPPRDPFENDDKAPTHWMALPAAPTAGGGE